MRLYLFEHCSLCFRVRMTLRSAAVVKGLRFPKKPDWLRTASDCLRRSLMKRMHVHVAVDDLSRSIGFYSALFDAKPAVGQTRLCQMDAGGSARQLCNLDTRPHGWPRSPWHCRLENKTELHEVYARLNKAGGTVIEQGETACCYAKSEKSWIDDPAGISWETFHTTGENTDYGDGSGEPVARIAHEKACCVSSEKRTRLTR